MDDRHELKSPNIFLTKEKNKSETEENEDFRKVTGHEKWTEFYNDSTMHGLKAAFQPGSIFRRIFWKILLMGALLFSGYLFYGVLNQYLEYDFKVSKEIFFDLESLDFPRITICNMNSISKTKLQSFGLDIVSTETWMTFYQQLRSNKLDISLPENQKILNEFYLRNMTTYHEILSSFELGKQEMLDDTIIKQVFPFTCKYQGQTCTAANFTDIYTMNYGKCIVFPRYNAEDEKPLKIERNGEGKKLIS